MWHSLDVSVADMASKLNRRLMETFSMLAQT
jgi:hypothetical protein